MARFNIVLAGCGSMAGTWVEYALARPDASIVGLVDIVEDSARAMAERCGLAAGVFGDVGEAIRATGANLVFDVTIPASHRHIATTALALGCDVMGEKPMGASLDDARAMLEASRRSGRSCAVMQNRRYNRGVRGLQELVRSGAIGQPGFINADFFLGPHFGGFRDAMDNPLILDMAIHTFDQARMIGGADPVAVYCREFNPAGSWYRGNAAAVCVFEMSDGSVFAYRGCWCAEGAPTSWEASWRVVGSLGTAIWDGAGDPYAEVLAKDAQPAFFRATQRVEPAFSQPGQAGHAGCLDEMFAALAAGRKAETDCADNIKSTAMVFAAIESARRGERVRISLEMGAAGAEA